MMAIQARDDACVGRLFDHIQQISSKLKDHGSSKSRVFTRLAMVINLSFSHLRRRRSQGN
jgi:hypothetical protein